MAISEIAYTVNHILYQRGVLAMKSEMISSGMLATLPSIPNTSINVKNMPRSSRSFENKDIL
jgi:hypothetical protein